MVVCIIMYMSACVFGALLPGIQAIAGGLSRMEERARGWRLCRGEGLGLGLDGRRCVGVG